MASLTDFTNLNKALSTRHNLDKTREEKNELKEIAKSQMLTKLDFMRFLTPEVDFAGLSGVLALVAYKNFWYLAKEMNEVIAPHVLALEPRLDTMLKEAYMHDEFTTITNICNIILFCSHWVPYNAIMAQHFKAMFQKVLHYIRTLISDGFIENCDIRAELVDALGMTACPFAHDQLKTALVGKLVKRLLVAVHAGEVQTAGIAETMGNLIVAYSPIIDSFHGYLPLYERARTFLDDLEHTWGFRPALKLCEPYL